MPLTDAQRAYLSEPRFAVLAMLDENGAIWQNVMWYRVEGDTIVMNTSNARAKADFMRSNPLVSLCIEDGLRYISIRGKATIDLDPERGQKEICDIGLRYETPEQIENMVASTFGKQHRVTIEVPIEHLIVHGFE